MISLRSHTLTIKLARSRGYIYPVIILLLLVCLTSLRLSGTSMGMYDNFFYGKFDNDLVSGEPRGIRSDEWLVTTQLTIAQASNNFDRINNNFGEPKDMSVITDVPYREWSAVFKPQNFSFFVLPIEYAFAFKWWFTLAALLLSVYWLTLRFLPKKYLIASLVSIGFSCSPFIFWWYQTGTIFPITWGILSLIFALRLINPRPIALASRMPRARLISKIILCSLLTYSMVAFGLLLYPPFQIPIVICLLVFYVTYLMNTRKKSGVFRSKKSTLQFILPVAGCVLLTIGIIGLFIVTRISTFQAITGTVYPGKRDNQSGKFIPSQASVMFYSFGQYILESKEGVPHLPTNQSGDSSFLILSTSLIPALLYLLSIRRRVDWVIIGILLVNVVFLAHYFIPQFSSIAKIFALHIVPPERLVIGFGFLGLLSLIYILRSASNYLSSPNVNTTSRKLLLGCAGLVFIQLAIGFITLDITLSTLFVSTKTLFIYAAAFGFALTVLVTRLRVVGLAIFAIMGLITVWNIHPLYRGLGPVYQDGILGEVKRLSNENDVWGAAYDLRIENIPIMAGVKTVTGTQFYPNNTYWRGVLGPQYNNTYNRYAHIILNDNLDTLVKLVQPDFYYVRLSCHDKISQSLTKIISTQPLKLSCYQLIKVVDSPVSDIYIYKKSSV